jgi:hypothetical protein
MKTMPMPSAPTLELLRWVAARPRSYAETIDVWSSWCPRHSIWEDAVLDGLVRVVRREVVLTTLGHDALRAAA